MIKGTIVKKKHPIHIAGKVWVFDAVAYTEDEENKMWLSMAELERVHRAVANAICSKEMALTGEEFEFLCDLTDTSNREVASLLELSPPAITKWKKQGRVPKTESLLLKEIFWVKLFGTEPKISSVFQPVTVIGTERLKALGKTAIDSGLVDSVSQSAA